MPSSACKKSALRSEEHTSELELPCNLVCRLLLEKIKVDPLTLAVGERHSHAHHHQNAGGLSGRGVVSKRRGRGGEHVSFYYGIGGLAGLIPNLIVRAPR